MKIYKVLYSSISYYTILKGTVSYLKEFLVIVRYCNILIGTAALCNHFKGLIR